MNSKTKKLSQRSKKDAVQMVEAWSELAGAIEASTKKPNKKAIAASNIIGMMEDIKRKSGPVLGMLRLHWPESRTYEAAMYAIYDRAVWIQNEMRRLREEADNA